MWELIRANKRKSVFLVLIMGIVLVGLGYVIAVAWMGSEAGMAGIAMAMMIWAIMAVVSFYGGDRILITMSGAQKVDRSVNPRLWNVVEEMKISAGLPAMPEVYIIPTRAMNAYATGIRPERCAVVVTAGLVERLNRDELQGVIAHELSHILNRDLLFMTLASVFVGSVVIISQVFLRGTFLGVGSVRGRGSRRGGGGHPAFLIIALLAAILAPIMVRLMYFAVSRRREYLADATAARLTRYPEGLASALEKIGGDAAPMAKDNKVLAPLYIVNPARRGTMNLHAMSSTHPATAERIKILRSLGTGCHYKAYQQAFNAVKGKGRLLPASALKSIEAVSVRQASSDKTPVGIGAARAAGDLAYAVGQYAFIACACGLRIKVPPEYKEKTLNCPRCHREHTVPVAALATAAGVLTALDSAKKKAAAGQAAATTADEPSEAGRDMPPLQHRRSPEGGWEAFKCSCGNQLQLSPYFRGDHLTCTRCCRRIDILQP
ncbi:MAG: M48 family metallopeptidase [Candidatus Cloacimonetes bacterium]|nr:M48 family metallopeptidase [Candidatus Cloacimonadota bacterium]